MNNKEIGDFGEDIIEKYLNEKGYKILARKYRNKFGEIDIIALKKDKLRFVEVKTRKTRNYGYPCEAVNKKKQIRIINSAKIYLKENFIRDMDIYFDVAEVYLNEKKINYIRSAFFM